MDRLREDFLRFARLHSWYKYIPLEGKDFYVYLEKGQQIILNNRDVDDSHGFHWHFSTVKPNGTTKSYKVRIGPFLNNGFNIIYGISGRDVFNAWISQEYPEFTNIKWDEKIYGDEVINKLFQKERMKYWFALKEAVFPSCFA